MTTDLNIYLLDHATGAVVADSADTNILSQTPLEFFQYTSAAAQDYDLVISKAAGPAPGRIKYVNFSNGDPITIDTFATNSSTVFGHAAAADAMAVAADPFYDQRNPEPFTSQGPTTILFDPAGNRLSSPEVRDTPAIASIDGTTTTFFGQASSDGLYHFFGTSAAAPHAAAVAALVEQANPGFTPEQVYEDLIASADPNIGGTPGNPHVVGAGLIDAYRAVVGQPVPAAGNVTDGFESGVLGQDWEVYNSGSGRTIVDSANGPATGAYQLLLDSSMQPPPGNYYDSPAESEAILHVNLTGLSDVTLAFDEKEFDNTDDTMPAAFSGHGNFDGVALSVDGVNWYRIDSLTGSASTDSYQHNTFDLSAIAAADGLTLGADTRIKFQQYEADSYQSPSHGIAFDNVQLSGATTLPVVTATYITITSTPTGLDGSYKIGDTVTALWNNSAGGDNNPNITAVTMDFSQFGGPAAVTAAETAPGSNHWTASYQIAPGSIDGIANVAVTATNATGSATAWDTANLSVDDEYPVVTDPHISITSTGSGPGGAYLPGDALTVRWDNSPNGDHNADALAATNPVMVDFSQLGGGSVAATETAPGSNLWTATYTVTGATRGTTLHVSVTVTDDAGNATTAADTTNLILMSGTTTTVTTDHLTGSVYGDLLTFTATVTTTPPGTGTPPGTVTFVGNFVGGSLPLGTESLGLNGIATFSTASLPAGSYTVTAIYSGSTTFDGSTSAVGANANVAPKALDVTATDRTKTYGQTR